jgi:hypothetical protein
MSVESVPLALTLRVLLPCGKKWVVDEREYHLPPRFRLHRSTTHKPRNPPTARYILHRLWVNPHLHVPPLSRQHHDLWLSFKQFIIISRCFCLSRHHGIGFGR